MIDASALHDLLRSYAFASVSIAHRRGKYEVCIHCYTEFDPKAVGVVKTQGSVHYRTQGASREEVIERASVWVRNQQLGGST